MTKIVTKDEAKTTARVRTLVDTVRSGKVDEGRQAITDELVKHGNVLTPEEGNQGPWVQLLVCLRAGLFGRVYTVEEIGLLVRRPMEPAPEAIARVDEAINWRIKRFVDQRIASQRVELYARLAAAMKRRLVA